MKAITQSEASDEAALRFNQSIGTLRRLEIGRGYFDILKEIELSRYAKYWYCFVSVEDWANA